MKHKPSFVVLSCLNILSFAMSCVESNVYNVAYVIKAKGECSA